MQTTAKSSTITHHTQARRVVAIAIIIIIVALAATVAPAATITWGGPQNISGDTDVSTNGALVVAHNFYVADGGNAPVSGPIVNAPPVSYDATVNGVTFNGFQIVPLTTSATVGDVTLATTGTTLTGANLLGSASPPFIGLSADYQTLLRTAAFTADAGVSLKLTLGGLTSGQKYEFQWWVNASSVGFTDSITGAAGSSVTLALNTTGTPGGTGQFAIGTFIADNASQEIAFTSATGDLPLLNAFQLRQLTQVIPPPVSAIPEPGSALVGMLVLGLCGARLGRRPRAGRA